MKYVILADGTRIDNCIDSTTSNDIFAFGSTASMAASVLDVVTEENAAIIEVYDASGALTAKGTNLVLLPGGDINKAEDGFICHFRTRQKTHDEIVDDEIAELQEAILG